MPKAAAHRKHRYAAQARLSPEEFARLRKWFPKGSRVFVVLRHVSASGMQRTIGVLAPTGCGKKLGFLHPNHLVAKALGRSVDSKRDGIKSVEVGMDVGAELVYSLARALYGDGQALTREWV